MPREDLRRARREGRQTGSLPTACGAEEPGTPPRPPWMAALALFCLATVAFLVYRDLSMPHVRDVEVWLGFELHGLAAWLTAPLHWAVFGIGAWAFWRGRPWVVSWAAGYTFYVALSHLVWSEASPHGRGWPTGLLQALAISVPGLLLLRARRRLERR